MASARLVAIEIDPESIRPGSVDVQYEREIAIADILESNEFVPETADHTGPFKLNIAMVDKKLALDIRLEHDEHVITHFLSLSPFRRIIKDYFLICESYTEAIKSASPQKIEAIDMGRRGLHNEGSSILQQRLEGKINFDFDTARRLFTLICALHWKGDI